MYFKYYEVIKDAEVSSQALSITSTPSMTLSTDRSVYRSSVWKYYDILSVGFCEPLARSVGSRELPPPSCDIISV